MLYIPGKDFYSLPGGHIDPNEQPDEAMHRELAEETGVKDYTLSHCDFFLHDDQKIVLAYTGQTTNNTLESGQGDLEGVPEWIPRERFETLRIPQPYRELCSRIWPA